MRRTKKADRLAHIANWRTSGLSRPAYSRHHGLKYSTFLSWFKQDKPDPEPGKFVALTSAGNEGAVMTIIFPNGIRLEYDGIVEQSLIQYLKDA